MADVARLAEGTLVVLVGPSGSGKSTWAHEHVGPDAVVSSDRLRAVVGEGEHDQSASADAFAVLRLVVAARVRRRLTTVVDTLGFDAEDRQWCRDLAARHGVPCVAVVVDTPPAECRRRNAARERRVPAAVLSAQLETFARVRAALPGEGFDEVVVAQPVRVVPPSMTGRTTSRPQPPAVPGPAVPETPGPAPGTGTMRFGLHLSAFDCPGGAAGLAEHLPRVARAAEDAGFDSLWVMDHFRQVPQVGRPWDDMLEPGVALGALAAATSRIRLGCLVHAVGYRNLGHLAKVVATLDVLSGGRAWCGLGAGWYEPEYTAYGYPFGSAAERLDLLEDALQALPLLWGKGSPPFEGRVVRLPETMCYPRPLQANVPILVGGGGERRTLRLVAQYADACNLTGEPDAVRHKVEVLRRHCADVGRDPADVEVTHLSTALVAPDAASLRDEVARRAPARGQARWRAWTHPGTIEDHVLRVGALRAAGVQHVVVSLAGVWDSPAVEHYGAVVAAARQSRGPDVP
ncbi:TIGR03560 family F420-dependent LLM class oxidoreductase [Kineosporia sp. A_224]|uniref:TIGR03560 family F420-dependent LLM class oxidoreductase n=1 Tax=Kineosporia sp. A_224 TaxID=1962180 RepID=UPI001303FBE0|nr:TIGR03560 family F420-dependent LLM class oxidoreductase [Kineosporia sp. A_224]